MSAPRESVESYSPIIAYLSKRLDRPAQLVLAHSYAELNQMIGSGEAIAAFVCSGGYVDGHSRFGLELIAAPEVDGRTVYYCCVLVPAGSKARELRDLRGKRFAFTDRDSNTRCQVPSYQILRLGERPESFFGNLIYTRSHDRAITAVREGVVDGAAVDSLIYEQAARRDPDVKREAKVIARYGPYASPPVIVSPHAPEQFKISLKYALLNMHKDAEGRKLLDSMAIDRFVVAQDSGYDSIRAMRREMKAWANQTRPPAR